MKESAPEDFRNASIELLKMNKVSGHREVSVAVTSTLYIIGAEICERLDRLTELVEKLAHPQYLVKQDGTVVPLDTTSEEEGPS